MTGMKTTNTEEIYGKAVWFSILQSVADHSEHHIDTTTLTPSSKVEELFPSKSKTGKNRLGYVLFDLFRFVNKQYGVRLEIDYPPRSEYINFPTLSDIWLYFITRLDDNLKKKSTPKKPKIIKNSAKKVISIFDKK